MEQNGPKPSDFCVGMAERAHRPTPDRLGLATFAVLVGGSVKTFVAAVIAIAAFSLVNTASAADVPVKAPIYNPARAAPYNWTGFYVGINGGYGTGKTTGELLPLSFFGNHDINGGLFGAQAGFSYQMSNVVLGVEADWDWADINGSQALFIFTESAKLENLGTLRARLGYAWDRVLLYGTGGWAWSSRVTASCPNCEPHAGFPAPKWLRVGRRPGIRRHAEPQHQSRISLHASAIDQLFCQSGMSCRRWHLRHGGERERLPGRRQLALHRLALIVSRIGETTRDASRSFAD